MHLNTLLGFATLVVVAAATRGELQSHSIAPSQSGWMTAPGNWGCCSVDSINLNPTTVSIENCSTMGGYCMGGKDIGAWIFELPDLPEGTTLVSARFTGGRYGAYGGCTVGAVKELEDAIEVRGRADLHFRVDAGASTQVNYLLRGRYTADEGHSIASPPRE